MATKSSSKGLLLTLGGAPDTPHVIEGLPGYYSPTAPHLVGDDLSLDAAKQAVKDHPTALKLVDVSDSKVAVAEDAHATFLAEGRGAIREARAEGKSGPAYDDETRTTDELSALKEA